MAYTTINKSTDYFNTVLYTGSGSSQNITGVGHNPDWVWIKRRNGTRSHRLFDNVRGVHKSISTNATDAEADNSYTLTGFITDGFSLGSDSGSYGVNISGETQVAWNWKAGGATGSSNSDGTITSTVSANTTAGFSIVSYTGNATSGATIGHGLSAVPKMIITKNRDQSSASQDWCVYHVGVGADKGMFFNLTNKFDTNAKYFNDTTPTSSVFTVGNNLGTNGSGDDMIAYCFSEKVGYSKFGSYTGNGLVDGTHIFLGFKPAFFVVKRYTTSGNNWIMYDNKRDVDNVVHRRLHVDLFNAEVDTSSDTINNIDFLSNGIKIRNSGDAWNKSGEGYIYMAFAEAPLVGSNNVPCTAR